MANRYVERGSTLLLMREVQTEPQWDVPSQPSDCYHQREHKYQRGRGCGEKGAPVHCWWDCKLVQPLWKSMEVPQTKNWATVHQQCHSGEDTQRKWKHLFEKIPAPLFTAALFTGAKTYVYSGIIFSHEKDETLPFVTWITLRVLRQVKQIRWKKTNIIWFHSRVEHKTQTKINEQTKHVDTENRVVVTRGGEGREMGEGSQLTTWWQTESTLLVVRSMQM